MGKHLKTQIIERLKGCGFTFEALPNGATPHKRGVHYCSMCVGVDFLMGAMDEEKEGRKYKKRIVVRTSRFRDGLFELYTYHFPKHWSAACVENREIIKEAQRRAHALEKDCTAEGLRRRLRRSARQLSRAAWQRESLFGEALFCAPFPLLRSFPRFIGGHHGRSGPLRYSGGKARDIILHNRQSPLLVIKKPHAD